MRKLSMTTTHLRSVEKEWRYVVAALSLLLYHGFCRVRVSPHWVVVAAVLGVQPWILPR
jgi:hypothetical protein